MLFTNGSGILYQSVLYIYKKGLYPICIPRHNFVRTSCVISFIHLSYCYYTVHQHFGWKWNGIHICQNMVVF